MAKGGSGDVLTGILTALKAQGYESEQAAILGVYIHGMAGDLAASKFSTEAMLASDIIESLSIAFPQMY
jgi:ADP-dependent NAD(P)H-hydrate dehydratase / NAD(P)H-hydrate epimerase